MVQCMLMTSRYYSYTETKNIKSPCRPYGRAVWDFVFYPVCSDLVQMPKDHLSTVFMASGKLRHWNIFIKFGSL